MASLKSLTVGMMVTVVVSAVLIGVAMRRPNWMTASTGSGSMKTISMSGLWASCVLQNPSSMTNWALNCQSSEKDAEKKAALDAARWATFSGAVCMAVVLVLSVVLTVAAFGQVRSPGALHKAHVANSVLLGLTVGALLVAAVAYPLHAKGSPMKLGPGYAVAVLGAVTTLVSLVLCAAAGKKLKSAADLGAAIVTAALAGKPPKK